MKAKFLAPLPYIIAGSVAGFLNYFFILAVKKHFSQFGAECIPPGEPFLTCGPGYVRMDYGLLHLPRQTDIFNFPATLALNLIVFILLSLILYKLVNPLKKIFFQ